MNDSAKIHSAKFYRVIQLPSEIFCKILTQNCKIWQLLQALIEKIDFTVEKNSKFKETGHIAYQIQTL